MRVMRGPSYNDGENKAISYVLNYFSDEENETKLLWEMQQLFFLFHKWLRSIKW